MIDHEVALRLNLLFGDDELFSQGMVDRQKMFTPYFQPGLLS